MKSKIWNDFQLTKAVKDNKSYAGVLRSIGLKVAGSNYDTIKKRIKELNLDISHFAGKGWNKGLTYLRKNRRPLSEILILNSNIVNSNSLRKRILKENIKEHKCEMCNNTKWLDKPIPLELHHINGIKNDLRLENLQLLCPNCHALTDNYRGKNIGMSAQKETFEVEVG